MGKKAEGAPEWAGGLAQMAYGVQHLRKLYIGAICAAAVAALAWPTATRAQIPINLRPGPPPAAKTEQLPSGVRRAGNFEIASVRFEHKPLFDVAAPLIRNRREPGDQIPVETRVGEIEGNLRRVLTEDPHRSGSLFGAYDTLYDPSSFRVDVVRVSGRPVLVAGDQAHPNDVTLLTVTAQDSKYYGVPADDLAKRWQGRLQDALVRALAGRQPELVRRHIQILPPLLGAIAAVSAALWLVGWRLRRWRATLQAAAGEPARTQVERKRQLVSVFQWIVVSALAVIWLGGLVWILSLFPATAWIPERIWKKLLALALIWSFAGLLARLGILAIQRFMDVWEVRFLSREDFSRRSRRIPTISRAVQGLATIVVYLVATGASLKALGVPTASLLTLGALVAFAVSFAAQSIIKDLTAGFLILVEDQFAIGDYVWIGAISGVVEHLSLRTTRVREDDGRLTTIPNSQVSIVQNATRDWGRVDVTVNVANDIDIERALSVIADVADQLSRDPSWSAVILEPPRVLGIDAFSHAGVAIRVWIVTLPLQRVPVRREFNRRVLVALQQHGIEIGVPQQIVRPVMSGGKAAAGSPAGDTEEAISLATPKATGSSR